MTGLLGQGVLINWGGVLAGTDADFNAWHSREHLPERLAIPGFLRGRRCIAAPDAPDTLRYLMMYETETPEVLVSPPYLARLNDPTPWTQRILSTYVAPSRTVCTVVHSEGHGIGGWLASVAFADTATAGVLSRVNARFRQDLRDLDGIVGLHILEGSSTLGQQPTKEKSFREAQGYRDVTVGAATLIDALSADGAQTALDTVQAWLDGIEPLHAVIYQTQHVLVAADVADH